MDSMEDLLRNARVIAVVGCSDNPMRDSYRIADYLMRVGYTVYPVNPTIDSVLGMRSYPDVTSIPERVDIVNIFRRPSFVASIVEDAIAAGAGAVWLQLGVGEPEAENRAREAGLDVVSEHCIAVEHRVLGIGRRQPDERAG
jgi:predicted CoA-binding protein